MNAHKTMHMRRGGIHRRTGVGACRVAEAGHAHEGVIYRCSQIAMLFGIHGTAGATQAGQGVGPPETLPWRLILHAEYSPSACCSRSQSGSGTRCITGHSQA